MLVISSAIDYFFYQNGKLRSNASEIIENAPMRRRNASTWDGDLKDLKYREALETLC